MDIQKECCCTIYKELFFLATRVFKRKIKDFLKELPNKRFTETVLPTNQTKKFKEVFYKKKKALFFFLLKLNFFFFFFFFL
ncbi:hypothetical protein [Acinetobacter baumannii]|uniref:hypothetical protein n=1 Tax=Acinetobacter baumannii TaxID=470 RepID=UPI0022780DFE|nr:hypothetical protein [Acinetobacter baumannii]MCY3096901.1 hypothetical protein [Acinetobacter baumannii]